MATMDVFNSNAFSTTSLTGVVDKVDFKPQLLGSLNIFEPMPVRTSTVFVDRRENTLALIPSSERGSPPSSREADTRTAVPLQTVRLAKDFTLYAHEIQNIRAFGTESELEQVQAEFLYRMNDIRDDMELTHEYHRLGALQGKLLDSDGTTVIYNYYTELGVTEPSAVSFELDVATTNVRGICQQIVRSMWRASKGSFIPGQTTIHALAGDSFYDSLIDHDKVRDTYQNFAAAADLREDKSFRSFTFGGITYHNYQGTDDNSTVAIPVSECKFFPVGARGVFKKAMAPAEFMPYVNTLGQDVYAMNIPDRDRQAYTKGEIYSYPLYICQRPGVLQKATLT